MSDQVGVYDGAGKLLGKLDVPDGGIVLYYHDVVPARLEQLTAPPTVKGPIYSPTFMATPPSESAKLKGGEELRVIWDPAFPPRETQP
jgi:hypothetical protein